MASAPAPSVLGLVAGYAAPPEPQPPAPPERHLDVEHPGQLVQLDCFCIGRLSGTKGTVWQYTAIDVASAYAWATLQVTRRNPSAVWTSQLARTVAAELAKHGWKLERVMSDNASEFRCPLPDPQADRPPPRSRALPSLLQHRAGTRADGPRAALPKPSSGRPSYGRRSADASPQLGDRKHN
jgi:hypothetical protein